jgi:AraC-like DNA-binding protein
MVQPFRFSNPEVEPVAGARQQAFMVKAFNKRRFDFVWHLHPEFELTWIQRGYGVRYAGNSIRPFQEGDLCLLGGNLPHAYGAHPRHTGACKWLVIHFLPEVWGSSFWELSENRHILRLLRDAQRGINMRGEDTGGVRDRLDRLSKLGPSDFRRLPLFVETLQLLASHPRSDLLNPRKSSHHGSGDIDSRIGVVFEWIEAHASENVRQADVARLVNMSAPVFSRFFHQKTGRLFSRYLNEIRIARVCTSLATTNKTVAEIAFESGFNNLANFNRRFAEVVHSTPGTYRREMIG